MRSRLRPCDAESQDWARTWAPRVRQRPNLRRFIVAKHFKVFYRIQNLLSEAQIQNEARTVEILRFWDAHRGAEPS